MGADNLLEATVVTPSGRVVIANECQHSDLFYAIRGGGGGTYGVVLSATMKAYPNPQTTFYTFQVALTDGNKTKEWWDLMAYIHSEFPRLKAGGLQGYYGMAGPPIVPFLAFSSGFYLYNKPNGTAEELFGPIKAKINNTGFALYQDSVVTSDSFFELWNASVAPEYVANGGGSYGSRLLSTRALTEDLDRVAKTFAEIGPGTTWPAVGFDMPLWTERPDLDHQIPGTSTFFLGHFIANSNNRGLDIGLNHAWRDAQVHFIVASGWPDGIPQDQIQDFHIDITYNKTRALRELDPDSGAYFNEV
jgi:hypothetical protein